MGLAWVTGALAAVSSIGLLATSGWLISRSAQRPPVLYLMVPVAAVQAFGIGRAAFRYAERLTGHDAALRLLAGLRVNAYGRLERLAPAGLAEFRSGDLISRLVSDIDSLTGRWLLVRLPYATAACAGLGAVAVCAAILPSAATVLAGSLAGVAVAAPLLAGWFARRAERQLAPSRGDLAAATVDLLRGAGELAVFRAGCGAAVLAGVSEADVRVAGCERRSAYGRGSGAAVTAFSAGAALWGTLALGAAGVRSGAVSSVALAVLVLVPLATHEVFGALAPAAQRIPLLRVAHARVAEVMSRPEPVTEPDQPAALPGPPYDITIRGLIARWSPDGPAVLNEMDLDVPAGARIAVTGPSGSGKTTLAMVLLRFLEPAGGRVTLGGTDIRALDGEQVRSVIGLCAQDAHIFASTLRENLRIARPDATDDQLADALDRARLLDWVRTLPDGLDTRVGERGAQLSGGQRQRLALARVLLADFPVVIFDEPAEHLDDQTADALTRDLLTATYGRTVILITHRSLADIPVGDVVTLSVLQAGGRGYCGLRDGRGGEL